MGHLNGFLARGGFNFNNSINFHNLRTVVFVLFCFFDFFVCLFVFFADNCA